MNQEGNKRKSPSKTLISVYIYKIYDYVAVDAVDLNSFICKRPFFANKNVLFAGLQLSTFVLLRRTQIACKR